MVGIHGIRVYKLYKLYKLYRVYIGYTGFTMYAGYTGYTWYTIMVSMAYHICSPFSLASTGFMYSRLPLFVSSRRVFKTFAILPRA